MPGFGGTIKLSGETEYRKALKNINSDLKLLSSEMKTVTSAYDKNDKSVEKLNKENEVLNKQISEQQKKVDKLREAVEASTKETGENSETTKKWQIELNNAQAQLNKLNVKLEANRKAIRESDEEIKDATRDVDKFGDEVRESGNESSDASEKFEKLGNVGKVAMEGIAVAAAAALASVVAIGKGLVDASVEAAHYADDVLTQSQVTGISTDKLQGYMYAAELVDVATDTLTGSMAKNIRSMSQAAQGSSKYVEAYEALGVAVTNADGSLRDSEDTYWDIIDALGRVENDTERDAIAMQLLGRSAQDLNPLIKAGSSRLRELSKEAKDVGYTMSDSTLKAFGEFDDQLQRLEVGSTAAKNALGTILLPVLTDLSEDGVDLLSEFTNGILEADGDVERMSGTIETLIPKALDKVGEKLPMIGSLVGSVFKTLGSTIFESLPEVSSSITGWISGVVDELLTEDNISEITNNGVTLFANLFSDTATIVTKLVEKLPEIVDGLVEGLCGDGPDGQSNIQKMEVAGIKLITSMIKAMPSVIGGLLNGAVDIVGEIFGVNGLTSPDAKASAEDAGEELGKELLLGIWEGIRDFIPNLLTNLFTRGQYKNYQGLIEDYGNAINVPEFLQKYIEGDSAYFAQHPDAMTFKNRLEDYSRSHQGASFNDFLSYYGYDEWYENMSKLGGTYEDVAKQAEESYEKIKLSNDWIIQDSERIADSATDITNSVTDTISHTAHKLTDEGSPDNVKDMFRVIGQDMMAGIAEGIRSAQNDLADPSKQVEYSIVDIARAAKAAAEVNSPSKLFAREIGEPIMEGIAYGIDNNADTAIAEVQDTISRMSTEVDPNISVDASKTTNPIAISVNFGDVTISDGTDLDTITEHVADAITQTLVNRGGAIR